MTGTFGGCAACIGDCCRRYVVPLTVDDVLRLVAATALHPAEFVALRPTPTGFTGFRIAPDGEVYLTLAKRPAQPWHHGACTFLLELPGGQARCGVYPARPGACRTFPTTPVHGTAAVKSGTLCGPDAWNAAVMDLPRFRRDLKAQANAWSATNRIAATWNRARAASPRTGTHLFRFLLSTRDGGEAP